MFLKYPKIGQFSDCVGDVRRNNIIFPTLEFNASVKMHGTNAAVGFDPDGNIWFQSRQNIITPEKDNAGFAKWAADNIDLWRDVYAKVIPDRNETLYIFGEWYGKGIQKGIAVSSLSDKYYGIFDMIAPCNPNPCEFHEFIHSKMPNVNVINTIAPQQPVIIDFANPALSQNCLLEMALAVEAECPVGKYHGVSGIGEGLVFSCNDLKFKVKGKAHSETKVKTLRELSAAEIEKKESAKEFAESVCTDNRFEKGIDYLNETGCPLSVQSTGMFLKWAGNDIIDECLDSSGFERKEIMPLVSAIAKKWFFERINKV